MWCVLSEMGQESPSFWAWWFSKPSKDSIDIPVVTVGFKTADQFWWYDRVYQRSVWESLVLGKAMLTECRFTTALQ